MKIVRDDGTEMALSPSDRQMVVNGLYAEVGRLYRSACPTCDTIGSKMVIADSERLEDIAKFVLKP